MTWIDIAIIIILILSFLGGLKEGAVKTFSTLVALIIAIPLTGLSYRLIAAILSFLPGTNWENFIGFFITMGITSLILQLVFLIPRKIVQRIWGKGCLWRLVGGVLNTLGSGIGMTVFTLVLLAYPIFDWLERWVSSSGILTWLVNSFGFVPAILPDILRNASQMVAVITGIYLY